LSGQDPGLGNIYCAFIDVQDVVKAHIQAVTILEATRKWSLLTQTKGVEEASMPEIAAVLQEAFGPMIYKIIT
jgi:nucleoside-diphosphate-sugar epimerase